MAQLITIASEMATAMGDDFDNHKDDFALDTRINLAMVHYFTSRDYVHAQRIRTQTMATFQHVLRSVDAIVTPAVAITAPPIRQDALPKGESDLAQLSEIMRFAPFTNLTGHPSISFPAGYDSDDLPIGFQAIAKPWEENVLFRLAYAAEQLVERKAPRVHFSNL
jgi:aspartyl-tRNA(Asn)/glutamyl-tRNA(Gln) amidotransferase subunit A